MAGRRKYDLCASWIEERTCMGPMVGADHVLVTAIDIHDPDFIAGIATAVGLEYKLATVRAEIRLAVVALEGQLA